MTSISRAETDSPPHQTPLKGASEIKTRKRQSLPPLASHPVLMNSFDRPKYLTLSKSFDREQALALDSSVKPLSSSKLRASMDKPLPPTPLQVPPSPSSTKAATHSLNRKPRVQSMLNPMTTSWLDLDEKTLPTSPVKQCKHQKRHSKQHKQMAPSKTMPISKFHEPSPPPPPSRRSSIMKLAKVTRTASLKIPSGFSSLRLSFYQRSAAADVTSAWSATSAVW